MDAIVTAFGPAFAAGFAVQRALEIADPLLSLLGDRFAQYKGTFIALLSIALGLTFAWLSPLSVLAPLGIKDAGLVDVLITGFVISAGTEGINSILKFLGYAKDDKKGQAAQSKARANGDLALVDPHDAGLKTLRYSARQADAQTAGGQSGGLRKAPAGS